jgi:predicted acetyltransferase
MPVLTHPSALVHASFLEAMREFVAEGRGAGDDASLLGRDLRALGATWSDPQVFAGYVAALRADSLEDSPRPEGWVPASTWWWCDGTEYLGRIGVRHRLTDYLLEAGGHVGYDVRPSARLRGHATAMLRAVLPEAKRLGIERLLVTCDEDNIGSQRVIERCGGILEDTRAGKRRYWINSRASR